MTFEMNQHEAAALAGFLEKLRKRIPGDPWHKPGIENALGQARHRAQAPDLAIAAIAACIEPINRTPAIIGLDGPHWREATKPPRPLQVEPNERCSVCSQHHDKCRAIWSDDHEFESAATAAKRAAESDPAAVSGAIAALREDLPVTKPPTPPRTLDELAERDLKLKGRVDAVRAQIPKGPPLREPEPNPPAPQPEVAVNVARRA